MAKGKGSKGRVPVGRVINQLKSAGLGFDRIEHIAGSTYKNSSTVIVIPTRSIPREIEKRRQKRRAGEAVSPDPVFGIAQEVVARWQGLIAPMNQKRAMLFASGHEVGEAYNAMIRQILAHPDLSKWKYLMTLEDDNLPPLDAHIRLLESIEWGKFDAMSGIYFTKGEGGNMPMAYGDPAEYARTGVLEFAPRDIRAALAAGQIMPVNGIAMGCALWRMDLFREVPGPWFVTLNDLVPGKGIVGMTQDLSFCERAVRMGKKFAVDLRVKVGHMDVETGRVY